MKHTVFKITMTHDEDIDLCLIATEIVALLSRPTRANISYINPEWRKVNQFKDICIVKTKRVKP